MLNEYRIAIVISGSPRTFCSEKQMTLYRKIREKYLANCQIDFYVILKLSDWGSINDKKSKTCNFILTDRGLNNLNKIIDYLNPVYYKIDHDIKFDLLSENEYKAQSEENKSTLNQILMLNIGVQKLREYEKKNNFQYDYIMRLRPDLHFLLNRERLIHKGLSKFHVYTSLKFDAKGNDQMFFSYKTYFDQWWDMILKYLKKVVLKNKKITPEYFIFKIVNVIQDNEIHAGLIRNNLTVSSWEKRKIHFNILRVEENFIMIMNLKILKL